MVQNISGNACLTVSVEFWCVKQGGLLPAWVGLIPHKDPVIVVLVGKFGILSSMDIKEQGVGE